MPPRPKLPPELWPSTKACLKCSQERPLAEFPKKKKGRFGTGPRCNPCVRVETQAWRDANQDHIREFENNPERKQRQAEASKRRYEAKPEQYKAREHKRYHENKERERARNKDWYARNPEWNVLKNHKRRAQVKDAGDSYTIEEWKELCAKYDNTCLRCGRNDVPMTVDHVVPISKGGSNRIDNIQPLCLSCNSSKHTKTVDYRVRYANN